MSVVALTPLERRTLILVAMFEGVALLVAAAAYLTFRGPFWMGVLIVVAAAGAVAYGVFFLRVSQRRRREASARRGELIE